MSSLRSTVKVILHCLKKQPESETARREGPTLCIPGRNKRFMLPLNGREAHGYHFHAGYSQVSAKKINLHLTDKSPH